MNIVRIQTLIVTTPEELARGDETYATMSREISMPVQPYVGMSIMVFPFGHSGDKMDRWKSLFQAIGNPNFAAFRVESITLIVGDVGGEKWDQVTAFVELNESAEPTLAKFRAHIHMLEQFYGFERV